MRPWCLKILNNFLQKKCEVIIFDLISYYFWLNWFPSSGFRFTKLSEDLLRWLKQTSHFQRFIFHAVIILGWEALCNHCFICNSCILFCLISFHISIHCSILLKSRSNESPLKAGLSETIILNYLKKAKYKRGFHKRSTGNYKTWMFSVNQIWILGLFYCVGWTENERGCLLLTNLITSSSSLTHIYSLSALIKKCWFLWTSVVVKETFEQPELWEPLAIKKVLKHYLISAALSSLHVYCCAFIAL